MGWPLPKKNIHVSLELHNSLFFTGMEGSSICRWCHSVPRMFIGPKCVFFYVVYRNGGVNSQNDISTCDVPLCDLVFNIKCMHEIRGPLFSFEGETSYCCCVLLILRCFFRHVTAWIFRFKFMWLLFVGGHICEQSTLMARIQKLPVF